MKPLSILVLCLSLVACATPMEQARQDVDAIGEWLRGPMMGTCSLMPGPASRQGCVMSIERALAQLRGQHLTRDDHFRIELAKVKGTDEVRQLLTRPEREAWLRGPKTQACQQAPFPAWRDKCLKGVQEDLDVMSRPDGITVDPPEIRAERATARIQGLNESLTTCLETQSIEVCEQRQARYRELQQERQYEHEQDLARKQAIGQALLGLGMSGYPFRSFTAPPAPLYQPQPAPAPVMPSYQPLQAPPPVSCSTRQVGSVLHTDCY